MEVSSGASDACVIDLLMAGAMIGEGTSYPDLTYTVNLKRQAARILSTTRWLPQGFQYG